jgi:hypothetical protein
VSKKILVGLFGALALVGLSGPAVQAEQMASASPGLTTPHSCAVSISPYVAKAPGRDDTAAFRAAITAAVSTSPRCYLAGPSDAPQAVVYVPPGTYHLSNLRFPSNLRIEVSAGATLALPPNRPAVPSKTWTPMIVWDSTTASSPIVNVSLVGVGRQQSASKQRAVLSSVTRLRGFDIAGYFTMNLDPMTTNASNYGTGVNLVNVRHFLIANIFTIQNATPAKVSAITQWPTSSRAVFQLYSRPDSPVGGPFYDPQYGVIENQVNVNSPPGYGPNQVNSGLHLTFRNIYARGRTTLRLETDGSNNRAGVGTRGARVSDIAADWLTGENCNRVLALTPHAQRNGNVSVGTASSYSCAQSVASIIDPDLPTSRRGSFGHVVVRALTAVSGTEAQLSSTTNLWAVGRSMMPVYVAKGVTWPTQVQHLSATGDFTH